MATTAEMILSELEEAAESLLQGGTHDGDCTNQYQMKLANIPACTKHKDMYEKRRQRFRKALDQFKLLHDVFGPLNGV